MRKRQACGKVNLVLNIEGTDERGYHNIDTVIYPLRSLCDEIELTASSVQNRVFYSDFRVYDNDSALKMLNALSGKYGRYGLVKIKKNIPEGAGFGGSSADAAAVAQAYAELFGINTVSEALLVSVGSDVPGMFCGKPVRIVGTGADCYPIEMPKIYGLAVYKNGLRSSTKAVYAEYDRIGGETVDVNAFLKDFSSPVNALERAAVSLTPELGTIRRELESVGAQNVVMTGSGSGFITYSDDWERIDYVANALGGSLLEINKFGEVRSNYGGSK